MTTILIAGRLLALEDAASPLVKAAEDKMPMALPAVPDRASLDDIDDMVDTGLTLEALHAAIRSIAPQAPMQQGVAGALELAVAQFQRQAGLEQRRTFVTESFTGRAARAGATKLALEGITETIKTLIAKIIAWIKHVPARVIDFITHQFKGAGVYAGKAKVLQERAMDVKARFGGDVRPKMVIRDGSFVPFLAGYATAESLLHAFVGNYQTFNTHFSGQILGAVAAHVNAIATEVLRADAGKDFTNEAAAAEVDKAIRWLQQNAFSSFAKDGSGNASLQLPFGQAAFRIAFLKHGQYQVGLSVDLARGDPPSNNAGLPVLTPEEILQLTHAVADQVNGGLYHDYLKIKNELVGMTDTLSRTCDQIARRQGQNGPGAVGSLHFLKLLIDSQLKLTHYAYQYCHQVNAAITAYCAASLYVYEQQAKESPHEAVPALQVTDVAANDSVAAKKPVKKK